MVEDVWDKDQNDGQDLDPKALNANLRRLHFSLQTSENHIGLLSNYLTD